MISDSILIYDGIRSSAYDHISSVSLHVIIVLLATFSHRISGVSVCECGMDVTSRVVTISGNSGANDFKATNQHVNYLIPAPPRLRAYDRNMGAVPPRTEVACTSTMSTHFTTTHSSYSNY
jgi:hypothetical protein